MSKNRLLVFSVFLCLLFSGCADRLMLPEQEESAALACGAVPEQPLSQAVVRQKLLPPFLAAGGQNAQPENASGQIPAVERGQQFIPVELILQNPALPNGCEVTSLAMLLTSAGFSADHVELYEVCLPARDFAYAGNQRFGPSPEEAYAGDASSSTGGWYCFEGPILEAGNAWIEASGGGGEMLSLTGISQSGLDRYAQDGVPVAAWVTIGYAPPVYADSFSWILPDGELYIPYDNLHCVVLAGEENGQYRIADPISGWQLVDKEVFWGSFDAMGRRAVTVQLDGSPAVRTILS